MLAGRGVDTGWAPHSDRHHRDRPGGPPSRQGRARGRTAEATPAARDGGSTTAVATVADAAVRHLRAGVLAGGAGVPPGRGGDHAARPNRHWPDDVRLLAR